MGASFTREAGEGWSSPAQTLLLEALDEVLDERMDRPDEPAAAPRARGRAALCRMLARLVDAPAAAHVRYDAPVRTAHLTVWRQRSAGTPMTVDQVETDPPKPDWWSASRTRRLLLDRLDQRHLAELPLATAPESPSLLVVGRDRPFTETDSERMSSAHRSLQVVERVLDRVAVTPPAPQIASQATGSDVRPFQMSALTTREQEVLEMLGEGLMARSIAQRMQVSERTVHKHLGNLYRKLDAHDRLLAVRRAEVLGLLTMPPVSSPADDPARW